MRKKVNGKRRKTSCKKRRGKESIYQVQAKVYVKKTCGVIDQWYAVVWCTKQSQTLYFGQVKKRFLVDADGPVDCISFSWLKPKSGPGNILEGHDSKKIDVENLETADIIYKPSHVKTIEKRATMVRTTRDKVEKENLFEVNRYKQIKKLFEFVRRWINLNIYYFWLDR